MYNKKLFFFTEAFAFFSDDALLQQAENGSARAAIESLKPKLKVSSTQEAN